MVELRGGILEVTDLVVVAGGREVGVRESEGVRDESLLQLDGRGDDGRCRRVSTARRTKLTRPRSTPLKVNRPSPSAAACGCVRARAARPRPRAR